MTNFSVVRTVKLVAFLAAATLMASVGWCQSRDFTADSLLLDRYWNLTNSGESSAAEKYLDSIGGIAQKQLAPLVSFVRARRAESAGDLEGIYLYLDKGLPEELSDHALAMRARACEDAGRKAQAAELWHKVLKQPTSVFVEDAMLGLANYWSGAGMFDSLATLSSSFDLDKASGDGQQELKLLQAYGKSERSEHRAAIELLWSIYCNSPHSDQGRRARRELQDYAQRWSFIPRKQTSHEIELELAGLARAGASATGADRLNELRELGADKELAESLQYYGGLFAALQKKHADAITELQDYIRTYRAGRYIGAALGQLGKSAYARGDDSLAIASLEQLDKCGGDSQSICEGLETLTLFYMDRWHPEQAVRAATRWLQFASSTGERADALWRKGWAHWESHDYAAAAMSWRELSEIQDDSEYGPAARYWHARALAYSGKPAESRAALNDLHSRYTHSYYAVISSENAPFTTPQHRDLHVTSLDELWRSEKPHARKFALLALMRDADAALLEWPLVKSELNLDDEWSWWKSLLYLWKGDRMMAYRIVRNDLAEYIRSQGVRPEAFSRVVYPLDYDPWIVEYCQEYGVDPYFACGLICQESHYEPQIVSSAGAIGMMQLMPATARIQARKSGIPFQSDDLYEPQKNLRIGIAHLAELMREFDGDTILVLAAYNAGKSASQAWFEEFGDSDPDAFVEKIPYRETRLFVKRILEHVAAYRRLYPELAAVVPASKQLNEPKP